MAGSKFYFLRNRGNAIKIIALFSLVAVFYHQDFIIIGNEAIRSELTSYMLAIPFLLAYLIYRKRKVLSAAMNFTKQKGTLELDPDEIVGFALCLSSVLLYVYGSFSFFVLQWHMLSLPLFVSGCILLLFNGKVFRESLFSIFFLLLFIPLPLDILNKIGTEISFSTLMISYNILKVFISPINLDLTNALISVQNPAGEPISFMVDVPCGGFYSILGFVIFAIFAAYITYGSIRKKAALFSLGFLLIYSLNILRIIVTISISCFQNSTLGIDLFHLLGGPTLIFLGLIILLSIGQKFFNMNITSYSDEKLDCPYHKISENSTENFCYSCGRLLKPLRSNLKRDIAKFVTILILVSLILSSQLPVFVLAGSSLDIEIKKTTGEEITQQLLPPIEGYETQFIYEDKYFENRTGQDASLLFAYHPKEEGKSNIWVTVEVADAIIKLHSWEVCLLFWPEKIGKEAADVIELKDVQLLTSPPLIGRFIVFNPRNSELTIAALYWHEKAVFNVAPNWELKYIEINLLVYLDELVKSGELKDVNDYSQIESKLLSMAKEISVYWKPVTTWSVFTPLFAQWVPALIFSVIPSSLFVKVILETQKKKKRAKSVRRIELSSRYVEKDKKSLLIAEILRKHGKITGKELFELYTAASKESIDFDAFLEILKYAEKSGLIERDIKNVREQGLLVWKSATVNRKFTKFF
jgi:exosortase/archaeosortase family protein